MHTRAVCTRNARVRTVALYALSVYCGVCGPFSARLSPLAEASKMPHSNPKGGHVPTTM